jgi:hypothetical protein
LPADPAQYSTGSEVIVLDNNGDLKKAGFAYFTGWNRQADGLGDAVEIGTYFRMGSENVTLYAQYGDVPPIGAVGPAGGNVFYDKGSYSNGWRYLEAAPVQVPRSLEEVMKKWWVGTQSFIGATGTAVGTGEANTAMIAGTAGSEGSAAKFCADLVYGGCDDWFLPSIDELELIYNNLKKKYKGNFNDDYYWSSSELSEYDAYAYHFYGSSLNKTGIQKANGAVWSDKISVRAVRAF